MQEKIVFQRMSRQLAAHSSQPIRVSAKVYDTINEIKAQTGLNGIVIMDTLMDFVMPLVCIEEPENYRAFKSGAELWGKE